MNRTPIFAIRLHKSDKAMLKELSHRLDRNQSDTIRSLVRGALAILREQDAKKKNSRQIKRKEREQ